VWASGSDPGFITETLRWPLLSVQRRVDLIEIEEFGDLSHRPSTHMVMEQMRFGKPLAEFDPDRPQEPSVRRISASAQRVGDVAGFSIDEWTAEGGVAAAVQDMTIVAGQIKAGTRRRAADHHPWSRGRRRPDSLQPSTASSPGMWSPIGACSRRVGGSVSTVTRRSNLSNAVPRAAR